MHKSTQKNRLIPWLAGVCSVCAFSQSLAQQSLTIAAFPAVDEIVRAAIPAWKKLHPNVDIKVVSRQFGDHHTAMTTALSTSFYLPDVMALEVGYVGRFAQGGGLENLANPPYNIKQFQSRFVPYAFAQATNRAGAVVGLGIIRPAPCLAGLADPQRGRDSPRGSAGR